MANYRSIHTKFWNDGTVEGLTPDGKLLMLYMITNPYRNESCLYNLTIKRMGDDTGLRKSRLDKALNELIQKKRIVYDFDEEMVWVVNAIKHQPLNENCRISVRKDIEMCPSIMLASSLVGYYSSIGYKWIQEGFEGLLNHSEGLGMGSEGLTNCISDSKLGNGSEPIAKGKKPTIQGTGYRVQGTGIGGSAEGGEPHPLQQWIKDNLKNVSKLQQQLTHDESERILSEFDKDIIRNTLEDMDNYKKLTQKYVSVNRTLRNWIKIRTQNGTDKQGNKRNSKAGGSTTREDIERTYNKIFSET